MFPRFLKYLLFFLSLLLIIQFFTEPPAQKGTQVEREIELNISQTSYTEGDIVSLTLKNNTDKPLAVPQETCETNPLNVYKHVGGLWEEVSASAKNGVCVETAQLQPGQEVVISYGKWNFELFGEVGKYKIEFPYSTNGDEKNFFVEFDVSEPSFFKSFWRTLFYKPIYNILIYLVAIVPDYSNLGIAIILLTLLIKFALLGQNNKAIKSQQELQKVQPILNKIKTKYAGDQQKVAQETMKVWKEHKINPFGSCLPLFIQLPIMLALFYVVQDGLNIEENTFLLYEFVRAKEVTIDPLLFGIMDLTTRNVIVLPLLVGGMQYYQMNLITPKRDPKQDTSELDQAQMMGQTMKYILPIMIAFFTASMPAAVGLYWGTSTLFAIVQQWFIMQKK